MWVSGGKFWGLSRKQLDRLLLRQPGCQTFGVDSCQAGWCRLKAGLWRRPSRGEAPGVWVRFGPEGVSVSLQMQTGAIGVISTQNLPALRSAWLWLLLEWMRLGGAGRRWGREVGRGGRWCWKLTFLLVSMRLKRLPGSQRLEGHVQLHQPLCLEIELFKKWHLSQFKFLIGNQPI